MPEDIEYSTKANKTNYINQHFLQVNNKHSIQKSHSNLLNKTWKQTNIHSFTSINTENSHILTKQSLTIQGEPFNSKVKLASPKQNTEVCKKIQNVQQRQAKHITIIKYLTNLLQLNEKYSIQKSHSYLLNKNTEANKQTFVHIHQHSKQPQKKSKQRIDNARMTIILTTTYITRNAKHFLY